MSNDEEEMRRPKSSSEEPPVPPLKQLARWALASVTGAAAAGAVAIVSIVYVIPALEQTVLTAEASAPNAALMRARYESETGVLGVALEPALFADGEATFTVWLTLSEKSPVRLGILNEIGRLTADVRGLTAQDLEDALVFVTAETPGAAIGVGPGGEVLVEATLGRP